MNTQADKLLALLPDDATLDAVDDDQFSGRRPCPVVFTIAQVRELRRALAQPAEAVEYPEAAAVCAEAYQVVGCMLDDLGIFGTERAQKILDNLSQHRLVHDDVLPWPSMETDAAQGDVPLGTRKAMQLGAECLRKSGTAGGPEYADVLEYWLAKHPAAPAQGDDTENIDYICSALGCMFSGDTLTREDEKVIERARKALRNLMLAAAPSPEPRS